MGIRKSKEETFKTTENINDLIIKIEHALLKGDFSNIKTNIPRNQITGDYKNLTVWGEIIITLLPEIENVKINAKSTANVDNVFTLFTYPNQKIFDQFKKNSK